MTAVNRWKLTLNITQAWVAIWIAILSEIFDFLTSYVLENENIAHFVSSDMQIYFYSKDARET